MAIEYFLNLQNPTTNGGNLSAGRYGYAMDGLLRERCQCA